MKFLKPLTVLTVTFCITTTSLLAQPKETPWTESGVRELAKNASESEIVMNCSMLTQEGYLYYAEILADRLLEIKPESPNYNYRKGFLILEIRRDYIKAIPYFQKAVTDTDPNFDMYSPKELSAPADAHYHMAKCYHYNLELDKAEEQYNKFIEITRKKSELIPQTQLRLIQLENARKYMASPVNCELKNLGSAVNTQFADYSSVISFDGSALYLTSRRPWENGETEKYRDPKINQYPEDVYVTYIDFDGTWTAPIKLAFCETKRNEATIAVSTDERRIYLYEDSTGLGDFYYSDFVTNKFDKIQKMNNKSVNTDYWETHIMVSHDGNIMVFASERPGGYGGRDLYIMRKNADGTWAEPTNMGPQINTKYDEDAPFISVGNNQLYFASNGEMSMGEFDILMSEIQADGTWSTPKNLGFPFNSTNDDLYYTTTVDGLRGYITSYRADGLGEKDIYEIKNEYLGVTQVCVLKGDIKTKDGSPLPENIEFMADVTCIDCEEADKHHVFFPRVRDGAFVTGLKPCKTYVLKYIDASDKKVMGEETFTTKCDVEYEEIIKDLIIDVPNREIIYPEPVVEVPEVIAVDYPNLEFMHYFGYNKNKLTIDKGDLKKFIETVEGQLSDGRVKITINIYSSASRVPTKTYETNEKLAKIRAENMKYDLINYFESKPELKGKVSVTIATSIVQGPEYNNDSGNTAKYNPYQYVGLKTE